MLGRVEEVPRERTTSIASDVLRCWKAIYEGKPIKRVRFSVCISRRRMERKGHWDTGGQRSGGANSGGPAVLPIFEAAFQENSFAYAD